jgi:outer membrane protein assembly factor BamB
MVVVAVLVAMVVTAAMLKWRAQRARRRIASTLGAASPPAPGEVSGLGAGPPPEGAPATSGARMLHGDARHTHRAAGRAPTSLPVVAWSRDVGAPVEAQVVASSDEQTLYVASLGGTLTALAADDGSERWKIDLGDRIYATPCVADDGTIYVGTDAKKLVAVSPDGKVKWSFETEGDADSGPASNKDGTVVFAAGRTVYAVTPLGHVRWRFAAKRKVFTAPAITESGRVIFGSQDHRAYALSPDGRQAWSVDLGADVDGAAAIGDDGSVFMGTDGDEVIRLDAEDGRVVWRTGLGGFVRGTLSVARDGDVLAGVYGPRPRAVRLSAEDGTVRGDFPVQGTGDRAFGVHGGALEDAAGTLLFGAQNDEVYAVSARGKLLWHFTAGQDVDAPITLLSQGTVVVASDDGMVRALRTPRGAAPSPAVQ